MGGIGIIIRNTKRRIIAATCEPSFSPGDVVQLGAIAIRCGLCFARNTRSTRVIKEGDIRELFLALKEPGPCFASYGTLVEDIRMESVGFSELSFNCIPPSCNAAALSLAQEALSCNLSQVWFGECPAFLTPFYNLVYSFFNKMLSPFLNKKNIRVGKIFHVGMLLVTPKRGKRCISTCNMWNWKQTSPCATTSPINCLK